MNKLVVLIVIAAGVWFFREPLEGVWEDLKEIPPKVRTEMDMRGYTDAILAEIQRTNRPPEPLGEFIDDNFPPKGPGQPSSLDRFGNPYQIGQDRERGVWQLRSCGADGQCYTEDDILVDVVAD